MVRFSTTAAMRISPSIRSSASLLNDGEGLTLRAAGRVAARVSRGANGASELRYDPLWLKTKGAYPLSLRLPLRAEPHGGDGVDRWLEGLSPYGRLGAQIRSALDCETRQGTGALWRLLRLAGADAPGAFRFTAEAEQPPGLRPFEDLSELLARWAETPLMLGAPGVSHLLAEETDERLPVRLVEGEGDPIVALALHGAPSTHLLWLEPRTSLGALENRAFHLALGGAVGLPVCGFRTLTAAGRRALLTQRDDRLRRGEGWARLHRESLAQALGAPTDDRYGREPGPFSDLETIFQWADVALEARERLKLLDAFLFNVLIGAPDAHLLRYAIRLQPTPSLAPLMELAGPGLAPSKERRFSQRIGGAARWPERITIEQWRDFAAAAKLNGTFTLDRLLELAEIIQDCAEPVADKLAEAPDLQSAILGRFAREATERARDAMRRLKR